MPYVVTRLKPRKRDVSLIDFLEGLVTMDMLRPATKFETTGTKVFYYDYITSEKLAKLNIPKQLEALEEFYKKYKHLDIENKQELYETFYIPKRSSKPGQKKWRQIDAPSDELKYCLNVLKAMFEALMDGCTYHTSAFAYVPKRACKDAVMKHAQNKSNWFLKLDFSNFFGSTTLDFVIKMLRNIYPFSEIIKTENGEVTLRKCLQLCFLNGGLPQGTPMSPMLTNLMMIEIDYKLYNGLDNHKVESANGREYGCIYTRYADDLLISNRIKFNASEIEDYVKRVLDSYEAPFVINSEKTRFGSNAGANWNLGLMLNNKYEVTVGHKRKKRLEATINNYMSNRARGEEWELADLQHLQGEISYCESIEKENIQRIVNEYSRKFGDVRTAIKADIKAAS